MSTANPGIFTIIANGDEKAPGVDRIERWLLRDPRSAARLIAFMIQDLEDMRRTIDYFTEKLEKVIPADRGWNGKYATENSNVRPTKVEPIQEVEESDGSVS